MPWVFLAAAIAAELVGTLRLRAVANAPTVSAVALAVVADTVLWGWSTPSGQPSA